MKPSQTSKRVSLGEHLATHGIDIKSNYVRELCASIYTGKQEATIPVYHPTPDHLWRRKRYEDLAKVMLAEEKEAPVTSHIGYRLELEKAASGQDAEWKVLREIILIIHTDQTDSTLPKKTGKRVLLSIQNEDLVLNAIRHKGYVPTSLPDYTNGKESCKCEIRTWATTPSPDNQYPISASCFNKAWQRLLSAKKISHGLCPPNLHT